MATPGLTRPAAALIGCAAALSTLGTAELLAGVLIPDGSPLLATGAVVIDASPAWLKDAAITLFGTADKIALFVVMGVVATLLAVGIGLLARIRRVAARLLVLGIGLGLAAAVLSRPEVGIVGLAWLPVVLPTVCGLAVGLLVLEGLVRRGLRAAGDHPRASSSPSSAGSSSSPVPGRRSVLGLAATAGVLGAAGLLAGRIGASVLHAGRRLRETITLPRPAHSAPRPSGVSAGVAGMPSWTTPNDTFYRIDTALVPPDVDPRSWELRIHGLVEREVTLDFDELLERDLVEAWVTLACVSNEIGGDLVGNAKWLGLPVRTLLAEAGPRPEADMVLSRSPDGFSASTPLAALTDERDALLAVGMNDEPLPTEHGFPARLVVPGLYGYVSATKWVVELEVTRFADATAYWTDRGWSARGPIKTASRIDVPREGARVTAGQVAVGGTAWAQHRGITAVEIQLDDDAWRGAELAAAGGIDTWRQFSLMLDDVAAGEHRLRVRATDGDGVTQTEEVSATVPDGATGWHEVEFIAEEG
ncbi:molybdopterin-dependent oxidoreductase [Nesterenkonia sp. F]|uniref:molybdopterin-dependent oxidoreductase n=1 Tax=Nesterenkonia sp. F TaxID=795955 RepID=UPI000255CE6C|nr:molybdopterin-dependent oxidoreductase [Nesterenkonia sp. F]